MRNILPIWKISRQAMRPHPAVSFSGNPGDAATKESGMSSIDGPIAIAILDDYQQVALEMADWSSVAARAAITVFDDHLADSDRVVERLRPFDVVCVMRERTPLP